MYSKKGEKLSDGSLYLNPDLISKIRGAFYQVLLELFAYYKEFVGKDIDGETTFDIKRFC